MRICLIALMAITPLLSGCGGFDRSESTRMLKEASRRIGELEAMLQTERQAYSNRYAELAESFDQRQAESAAMVDQLRQQLSETREQVRDLKQYSISLQGHIVVLQKRLDTIRAVEEKTQRMQQDKSPQHE